MVEQDHFDSSSTCMLNLFTDLSWPAAIKVYPSRMKSLDVHRPHILSVKPQKVSLCLVFMFVSVNECVH